MCVCEGGLHYPAALPDKRGEAGTKRTFLSSKLRQACLWTETRRRRWWEEEEVVGGVWERASSSASRAGNQRLSHVVGVSSFV